MSLEKAVLDFRSDTLTQPTPGMRHAMSRAEVGDDVFQEDPSVNRLEEKIAELFGRDAALLVPSGTMANLIGLALHCQRGDEVILERRAHSFAHEVGGGAALFGLLFNPLEARDGILRPEQIETAIRPKDVHQPISRLVVIENTVNLAGGLVFSLEHLQALRRFTQASSLRLHMDGARIWHAAVATRMPLSAFAREVDSLSCCLSKGLGCPAGSLMIGDSEMIDKARWLRKMLGGGMRQAGVLAACGLYALEHHLERLEDDHQAAQELAHALRRVLGEAYRVQAPETNILLVHTDSAETTQATLKGWAERGILALPLSDRCIRLVTHLDIPSGGIQEAIRRLKAYS